MNNQFDERLVSRMSEVFDNYEDNFADEGWKELRKKFPVKQQRNPLIYWIGSAAAAIILAVGLWVLLPNQQTDESTLAKVNVPNKESQMDNEFTLDGDLPSASQTDRADEEGPSVATENVRVPETKENNRLAYSPVQTNTRRKTEDAVAASTLIAADNGQAVTSASNTTEDSPTIPASNSESKPALVDASQGAVLAANNEPAPAQKKKTFMDLAKEDDSRNSRTQAASKKVTFGVYAGSFVSYAQGSDNKVNVGAGFTSDIALGKKLKLSTGIAIAQNTLSFASSNEIPSSAQANFKAAFAQEKDKATLIQPIMYNLDRYDATLLGVDIPINLKYNLSDNKRDMYVSAGVSSGAFINESYTYHYSGASTMEGSLPVGSAEATPVQNADKLQKDFGNFDIARMLNLSFGMGYQVGNQQKLVIEPFVRYPLKGVGAENLRFGAGGVNLKLNFETNKRR